MSNESNVYRNNYEVVTNSSAQRFKHLREIDRKFIRRIPS